jgi:predicted transcriptional regulator
MLWKLEGRNSNDESNSNFEIRNLEWLTTGVWSLGFRILFDLRISSFEFPTRKDLLMARPRAKELTERELEVMQVFWKQGEMTAVDAREHLAGSGLDRAYTTIATLVRILVEKGFLEQQPGEERPFRFKPTRTQEEVSRSMLAEDAMWNDVKTNRLAAAKLGIPRSTLETKIRSLRINKHLFKSQ